jgi:hypothetical protein
MTYLPPLAASNPYCSSGWFIENYAAGPAYSLRTPEWRYNHQDTEELELYTS